MSFFWQIILNTLNKGFPFTIYGIFALAISVIVIVPDLQYDDGGIGGILILSYPIWGIIYWAPNELLFTLNGGRGFYGQTVITIILGLLICIPADYFIVKRYLSRRNQNDRP